MKYFRLYFSFLKNNIERELQFRFNFFVHMFTVVLGYLGNIIFYYFLYNNVDQVAGWGRYEIYILLATVWIIDSIFGGVFFFNLIQLPGKVRNYDLDYILLKPISPIFILSLRHFNLGLFSGLLFGITLFIYAVIKLSLTVSLLSILIYFILILSGVMILYSILFIMVTFSLKFVRINGLIQMFWSLVDFGKNPHSIYPNKLKYVLIFLIPSLVIYNYPAIAIFKVHYLLNMNLLQIILVSISVSLMLFVISLVFFRRTTKYYYN